MFPNSGMKELRPNTETEKPDLRYPRIGNSGEGFKYMLLRFSTPNPSLPIHCHYHSLRLAVIAQYDSNMRDHVRAFASMYYVVSDIKLAIQTP